MSATQKVTVLACHPDNAPSMRRYGELLEDAYRSAGWSVRVLRPSRPLSRLVPANTSVHKMLSYVEKLVLFPVTLPFRIRRGGLVHITDHSDSPWIRFVPRATPTLITCHDLIAIRAASGVLAEHRPRWTGRLYQRWIATSLQRATLIGAVSEATLDDVRRTFPGARSRLLRNPLSPRIAHIRETVRPSVVGRYLLLVSTGGWRKRRHLAIGAWQRLRDRSADPLGLVLVGDPLQPEELALARLDDVPDGVTRVTDIADAELAGLYEQAEGVLMLSSHEGFGWPVVEANWWGVVAVCAELSVFHEVGPANVFVEDDLNSVDWAAVAAALADPERRARVRADAQRFSPEGFTTELSAVASSVLGSVTVTGGLAARAQR